MTCSVLTLRDVAYTHITTGSPATDTVDLPDTNAGDLLVLLANSGIDDAVGIDQGSAEAAGWDVEFNDTAGFTQTTLVLTWRVCDGSEGATESTLFSGNGERLYAAASFSPSAPLPPASDLLPATPGWWPGSNTNGTPSSPFPPDSDIFTGPGGPTIFPAAGDCAEGFTLEMTFMHGSGITYSGVIDDPDFTVGSWDAVSHIETDIGVAIVWSNFTTPVPESSQYATDTWHVMSDGFYVSGGVNLTCPGGCPSPPSEIDDSFYEELGVE